ncbi:MAG: site-specific integrase [Oscillospiraceae bacterium]
MPRKLKGARADGLLEKKVTVVINGEKVRKSVYGHTPEELTDNKEKLIAYYENQNIVTFKKVSEEWEKEHGKEIEHYTRNCYKKPLEDVNEEFGNYIIDTIEPLEIQNFINKFARKGMARRTVKLRLTVLKLISDYAILHGYIKFNPTYAIKIPKSAKTKKVEAPPDEQIEIVKQSVNKEFGLFAFMLLYTGCRRSELLALQYQDIKDDKIKINKVVIYENGNPVIRNYTKTKSGMREVPLLKPLKNVIPKKKNGYIFEINKNPLTLSQLNIKWKRYKKETGIEITPHQLRHAFATICFDAGIDSKDAQYLLGHSKESVTRDIYTSIRQKRKEETAKILNEYLG